MRTPGEWGQAEDRRRAAPRAGAKLAGFYWIAAAADTMPPPIAGNCRRLARITAAGVRNRKAAVCGWVI